MSDRPKGELVIQTIAMPQDTNPNGDIFGGWVTSQMDLGSGILAAKTAQARVVTAAMEGMSFLQPVSQVNPFPSSAAAVNDEA
jgi:acyl-CoA thioesterase YciA